MNIMIGHSLMSLLWSHFRCSLTYRCTAAGSMTLVFHSFSVEQVQHVATQILSQLQNDGRREAHLLPVDEAPGGSISLRLLSADTFSRSR